MQGMVLLEEGREILNACRDLNRKLSHLEENTPINVASSITIASFLLPPILSRMKSLVPEIQINVRVVSANTSMEILKRGEADIAGPAVPENLLADSSRKKACN